MTSPDDLLIVIPSRSRPHNMQRLLDNLEETLTSDPTVLVVLDDDDHENYQGVRWWNNTVIVQPDLPTSAKLNEAIVPRSYLHSAAMLLSDDTLPRERGWDSELMRTLREDLGGTGYVYPDCGRGENLPELCVISTDIIRALGWFSCPTMHHGCIDHVWREIAVAVDRLRYRGDVHIDHLHPDHHTAPLDDIYRRARSWGELDARAYRRWLHGQGKIKDVETVRSICTTR